MKDYIIELIRSAEYDLRQMKLSKMSISERVLFERAKIRLETAKDLLRKFTIS